MKYFLLIIVLLSVMYMLPMSFLDIDSTAKRTITVAIQGAVSEDKIIELPRLSTVSQALEKVELSNDADLSALNRLTVLKDGDVLVIPRLTGERKVSINDASLEELMEVKGIGENKARRIVEYRQAHGRFQALEDLMNIPGIKQKTFDKLKGYLCL